jgi:hypothetical protein
MKRRLWRPEQPRYLVQKTPEVEMGAPMARRYISLHFPILPIGAFSFVDDLQCRRLRRLERFDVQRSKGKPMARRYVSLRFVVLRIGAPPL